MKIDKATNIKVAVARLLADADTKNFLEGVCHFRNPIFTGERDHALVAEGRRQVYLTLLTINECEPEQIVRLYELKEGVNHDR